jgi:hypothetical protein
MPLNARGGSLRQRDHQPSQEAKETVRAIVEGDPELQALMSGGAKPIELMVQRDSPSTRPHAAVMPAPKPTPEVKADEPFPWDAKAQQPPAPSAPPTPELPVAPPAALEDVTPEKPYKCAFFWENDPNTFGSRALLFGQVSDVAVLFEDIRVRYRSLTLSERMEIDNYLPPISQGDRTPDQIRDSRALVRLAMAVTHIQDRPLGETVEERMKWLRRLPEDLITAMHEAALEYQFRLFLRLRGIQEQLKN